MPRRVLMMCALYFNIACAESTDRTASPSAMPDSASAATDLDAARDEAEGVSDAMRAEPAHDSISLDRSGTSPRLTVEGEGLRIFLAPSGSARPVAFGTTADETMDMLRRVQGVEPRDEGYIEDCGVSYATWQNGLTVWFSRGRFAGWSVGRGSTVTTATGFGIGSTRADLDDAYTADVVRSTIGIEFTAGRLAGLLESEAKDARVLHLWAGVTCIAR